MNNNHNWAKRAESVIIRTIRENAKKPIIEIEKALYEAYPFGERKMYPYQVWLKKKKIILNGFIKVNNIDWI